MEFGKLANVDDVNWNLPAADPLTLSFLKSLPISGKEFHIGTPAWGHKEWIGKIYPAKTKAADFLKHYAKNFGTIELNTSHYRIPSTDQVKKWQAMVPSKFLFCAKVYQQISHSADGLKDKALLKEWFRFLTDLGPNRGPTFIQFPPSFDYSRKSMLFQFLQDWPAEFELALEFRHPTWFQKNHILPALTQYLQTRGIGLVILDVAGRRDLVHSSISAPFVMLRFIGNNLHPSDYPRATSWSKRFGEWTSQGLQKVFFFTHEPDDVKAPELADFVTKELNQNAGAHLPSIQWVHEPEQVSMI